MKTKSGNELFPVCLGCMGFGKQAEGMHAWAVDDQHGQEIIRQAAAQGMNFFDTAPVYNKGNSERILGKAAACLPREDLFIATKYYPRSAAEKEAGISVEDHVRNWLNGSLERLGTDYVDLYILHMWDWDVPVEEYLSVLNQLKKEGKIRYFGLSNVYAWQAATANERAKAAGLEGFSSIQNQWNLISREDERELVNWAENEGILLTPYASMAGGRLARRPGTVTERSVKDLYGEKKFSTQKEQDAKIISALEQIADVHNASMSTIALTWLIAKGAKPTAGATKKEQLADLVRAAAVTLSEEEMKQLEEHYRPHVLTGVLAEHTPDQDPYQAYGVDPMGNFD